MIHGSITMSKHRVSQDLNPKKLSSWESKGPKDPLPNATFLLRLNSRPHEGIMRGQPSHKVRYSFMASQPTPTLRLPPYLLRAFENSNIYNPTMWMFGVYLSFFLVFGGGGGEGDQSNHTPTPNPKIHIPQAQQTESNQIVRSLLLTKKSKVKAAAFGDFWKHWNCKFQQVFCVKILGLFFVMFFVPMIFWERAGSEAKKSLGLFFVAKVVVFLVGGLIFN